MVRFRQALIKLLAGRMPIAMNIAFCGTLEIEGPNAFVCNISRRAPA